MKKFAQILYNKAHWVFEAEEKPEFHESIIILDITDKPEVQEGWDYDEETGNFTEPVYEEIPVEPEVPVETVEQKIEALRAKMEEDQLTNLDVLMSIYEEVLTSKEPV